MKHTPGPWRVINDFRKPKIQVDGRKDYIAEIKQSFNEITEGECSRHVGQSHNEMMANAHLISAAPDLLEACYSSCHLCGLMHSDLDCETCVIGKAIRKAENN